MLRRFDLGRSSVFVQLGGLNLVLSGVNDQWLGVGYHRLVVQWDRVAIEWLGWLRRAAGFLCRYSSLQWAWKRLEAVGLIGDFWD